jgi:hypothetical protein
MIQERRSKVSVQLERASRLLAEFSGGGAGKELGKSLRMIA